MPVYLQIAPVDADGDVDKDKALKGDVRAQGHVHWIEVASFWFKNQGQPETVTALMSDGPGDVTFSRDSMDGISPVLMRWSGTGLSPFKGTARVMAIIHVVKGDQVYEMKLSGVILSAYQAKSANLTKDDGRTYRSESFVLSYSKMLSNYPPNPRDQDPRAAWASNASRGA